jgi:hemolysin activation/secretion protein
LHARNLALLRRIISCLCCFVAGIAIAASPDREFDKAPVTLLLPDLRVEGIVEYPQHGITTEVIHKDVLQVLVAHRQRISMQSLQDITSRITARYRAAGFVFTRAYIPAQKAADGIVVIRLLEGWLSDVDVYDNQNYRSEVLVAPFDQLKGKVLYSPEVEEALALVNDMPGVDAFGFFSIGDEVGSTRINLRIKREQDWVAALRVDNYGSPLTGEIRALVNAEWFNPTDAADVLKLGVLHSFEPENASFGYLQYQRPVIDARHRLGFEAAADQYDLGERGTTTFDEFRISGESQSIGLNFRSLLAKRGDRETAWQLDARYTSAESDSDMFPDVEEINTSQRDVALDWQWQQSRSDRKSGFWWQWNAGILAGHFFEGGPLGESPQYYLGTAYGAVGGVIGWLGTSRMHRWYVELDTQYSADALPATQQYSLTGATRARGFEPGAFVGDSGASVRAAWQMPSQSLLPWWDDKKWLNDFSPQLFAEYGYAVQRYAVYSEAARQLAPEGPDEWGHVADIGFGLDYQHGDEITINTSVAKAMDYRVSFNDNTISTCRVYVAATWHFD